MDHRLTRRGMLAGLLAAAALTACDGTPGVAPSPTPSFDPPQDEPIAIWELTGGLTAPGIAALRPPRLVIYGDGDAIADATYRSRLDPDQLRTLSNGLADDLRAVASQKKPTPTPTIVDAPVTRVTVWTPTGPLSFTAEGFDELKPERVYADALYNARDRLANVHKTVSATAQPYLATRVRVVAVPVLQGQAGTGSPIITDPSPSATEAPWPPGITLPAPNAEGLRRADLDGDAARSAVRTLTRDLDQRGAWPAYRMPDGTMARASWRYLLPNE
ncbi:hypothetical protein Dvina_08780 [Dactylosporangium vinaceum]|uniref:Uncharacterized protein n=1 Tax=Dactylosporangium vinaceum TaxID=53362 RepID=A0ABV5M072_9ACTN|nr:hypothetical protein [Dactylosporangium vinaceum]UAB98161.1 hypothetical protein Dvina_08780 [Dactylosporangium vinaceum]